MISATIVLGKCDRLMLSAPFKFFDRYTPLSDCDNISAYEKKDNCKLKQLAIIILTKIIKKIWKVVFFRLRSVFIAHSISVRITRSALLSRSSDHYRNLVRQIRHIKSAVRHFDLLSLRRFLFTVIIS